MDRSLRVSILIPVFNREKIIKETLESAINQTYKNVEIIAVDNNSTDSTYEIMKKLCKGHKNISLYRNDENIGPVRNWRKCLDHATGEYVKFLWSDDLIDPAFIEKTLPFISNNKNVGFVITGTEIFNSKTGRRAKAYFIGNTGIYSTKSFIRGSLLAGAFPLSPGCALFRRKDVEKNLLTDIPNKMGIDFKMEAIGNDVLVYLLTAKDYPNFAFINDTLSFFRDHEASITVTSDKSKVHLLYNIAKAYFVENYICTSIAKKYNATLFLSLKNHRNNDLGVKSLGDFYFDNSKTKLNYCYFFLLLFLKAINRIRQF